jgi:hypothetical protein
MNDFPSLEETRYKFNLDGINYEVVAANGNCRVWVDGWECVEDLDGDWGHWIGVVLFYLQEDHYAPAYTSSDVRRAGMVCKIIGEIPEFDVLNRLIGYSWQLNATPVGWDEVRRRISVHTHSLNANCEGAD